MIEGIVVIAGNRRKKRGKRGDGGKEMREVGEEGSKMESCSMILIKITHL